MIWQKSPNGSDLPFMIQFILKPKVRILILFQQWIQLLHLFEFQPLSFGSDPIDFLLLGWFSQPSVEIPRLFGYLGTEREIRLFLKWLLLLFECVFILTNLWQQLIWVVLNIFKRRTIVLNVFYSLPNFDKFVFSRIHWFITPNKI